LRVRRSLFARNSDTPNFNESGSRRMGVKMKTLDQVNDCELKYWEKLDSFCRLMFGCCVGFVSLALPIVLECHVMRVVRLWVAYSLVCALICAFCMLPVVLRSIRQYKMLTEEGKRLLHEGKLCGEVNPPHLTLLEKVFTWLSFGAAFGMVVCLSVGMYKSI